MNDYSWGTFAPHGSASSVTAWVCPECGEQAPNTSALGVVPVYCLNHEEEPRRRNRPEYVEIEVVPESRRQAAEDGLRDEIAAVLDQLQDAEAVIRAVEQCEGWASPNWDRVEDELNLYRSKHPNTGRDA